MNAIEFKEGIEKNRIENIERFLTNYEKKWGESIEASIDILLNVYIAGGNSDEPLVINTIKVRTAKEQGEWVDATGYEYAYRYWNFNDEYEYAEHSTTVMKKKLFRNVKVDVTKYSKRTKRILERYMYENLTETAKIYIKEIFIKKGFRVHEDTHNPCLAIYWSGAPIKD